MVWSFTYSLECEVKWALGSITRNKVSGGDRIPAELFQILNDDVVQVLHSLCQKIWKTQQWSQDWKRSIFILIPKKVKEESEKVGFKLNIQKTKIMASGPISAVQCSSVSQLCPTLCGPVDCSPPRSSVHGIFQAKVLEWVTISFSRGYS